MYSYPKELIHYLNLANNRGVEENLRHWKRDIKKRIKKGYIENKHDELVYWCIEVSNGWKKY